MEKIEYFSGWNFYGEYCGVEEANQKAVKAANEWIESKPDNVKIIERQVQASGGNFISIIIWWKKEE